MGISIVSGDEDVMLTTDQGVMIRFTVDSVSQTGRATQGVRLMRLGSETKVATFTKMDAEEVVEVNDDEENQVGSVTDNTNDEIGTDAVNKLLDRAETDQ